VVVILLLRKYAIQRVSGKSTYFLFMTLLPIFLYIFNRKRESFMNLEYLLEESTHVKNIVARNFK